MRTVLAVAWKEIQIYFSSPTAYIVGLIFLAMTGVFFARDVDQTSKHTQHLSLIHISEPTRPY